MAGPPIDAAGALDRRKLVQRIDVFITMLEKWPRDPTPSESEHVLRALRALNEGDYARGMQIMAWTEGPVARSAPDAATKLRAQYIRMNTAGLRARFNMW
ncbi:MAG: hypothetical protein HQ465_17395 [Rhodospirillales bacterium]|nr:hypothetical protein [Rhodospirillales bacterium]